MKILLTNDDGINAPGLNILADYLEKKKHDILVVAPDVEKSASSHSITLNLPLRIIETKQNRFSVTGSPADCVILALEVIKKNDFDIVISGINSGPNLGEDILYSGTVAAAIEAMYFGLPAIAVSLCSKTIMQYETAAYYIDQLLKKNIKKVIAKGEILNVNVPAVSIEEIRGIKITKTGNRRYKNFVTVQKDPRGREVYWLGGDKPEWMQDEETDIAATKNNFISLTPVSPNFTNYESWPKLNNWIEDNLNKER